ncbi:hypothetical protein BGZ65_011308 [Modicella reniformis]|uniref:Uncharacterized protein n=1 Tax=Modicella reniformis TaxID=1440133 RepID=A0A9P6IN00_9FUNG|nr:hypothetical protein BGZ65_011308 [Modicella reniformis]
MSSTIAPPASFGLVSGTAFASASPEALSGILDSLDLSSLEQEHTRLQRAIKQLEQSNKEMTEFIQLEQQEQKETYEQQQHDSGGSIEYTPLDPDPDFVLAIEENKVVIAKYEKACADLTKAIQRKRGSTSNKLGESSGQEESPQNHGGTIEGETTQDGVFL